MIHQPSRTRTCRDDRTAFVILMVLVIVVILSLVGYQYTDRMLSETKVSNQAMRQVQTRMAADAGVNYAMGLLATPDLILNGPLAGMVTSNPDVLHGISVSSADLAPRQRVRFSIVTPVYPSTTFTNSQDLGNGYVFGFIDEGSKINLNGEIKNDPTGKTLYNKLKKLPPLLDPSMEPVCASICIWLGGTDTTTLATGATDTTYSTKVPGYKGRYGPIDSLEELLLVEGMTPALLFGNDRNRNGYADADEDFSQPCNAGLSQFLTVYGRDRNVDSTGMPRYNLNTETDPQVLLTDLTDTSKVGLDNELASFIVLCRMYNPTQMDASKGKVQAPTDGIISPPSAILSGLMGGSTKPKLGQKISSVYTMLNSFITIPAPQKTKQNPNPKATYGPSPLLNLTDPSKLAILLDKATIDTGTEYFGRININTASPEVLATLPGITMDLAQKIYDNQPRLIVDNTEDPTSFSTPAWLLSPTVGLTPDVVQKIEKNITTRTEVYRFQVVGYFEEGGTPVRLEVVIDANGGQPRLLYRRDITELGKGFDFQTP